MFNDQASKKGKKILWGGFVDYGWTTFPNFKLEGTKMKFFITK